MITFEEFENCFLFFSQEDEIFKIAKLKNLKMIQHFLV